MSDVEEGQRKHSLGKTELELYKAALSNDWKKAENIYKEEGIGYETKITERGETALHIAALAGHTEFVENLVKNMNATAINSKTERGNTAFHCAAISGSVESAKAIKTKANPHHDLATVRGYLDLLPIYMAALHGNKEMVRFLYPATKWLIKDPSYSKEEFKKKEEFKYLLITLIKSDIYDVAVELAGELLCRQICPDKIEDEALLELAKKPLSSVGFFDRCIYPLLHWRLADRVLMNRSAVELLQLLWKSLTSDETKVHQFIKDGNVILEAAKHGNFEFLSVLIASNPHVLFSFDDNKYSIFHHAILNRHVEIFELIHIGLVKTVVTSFLDKQENNMLHLAGKLAPTHRLNDVPGAALQLQLELLWFEEVKKVMEPHEVEDRNISSLQKSFEILNEVMEDSKVLEEYTHDRAKLLFEELKMVMEHHRLMKHDEWTEDYAKLLLSFKKIETLLMEQDELREENARYEGFMEPHEVMDRYISSLQKSFEKLNKVMENSKVLDEYTHDRAKLLFEKIETLMGQDESRGEYTPYELFEKEHKELKAEGEKWMRDTANSCMVVTALITTIAFAAAITLPGGNADDGYPHFLNDRYFKIFAIADTVSLVSSASSLLSFLSILTARYTIDDFRWSLPKKLVIGLVTLFVSVVAMMVAIVMSIFIVFKDSPKLFAVVITVIWSLPVWLFLRQHCRLFVDVIYSTYTTRSLFKSKRDPNLLLKEKKKKRKSLFFL